MTGKPISVNRALQKAAFRIGRVYKCGGTRTQPQYTFNRWDEERSAWRVPASSYPFAQARSYRRDALLSEAAQIMGMDQEHADDAVLTRHRYGSDAEWLKATVAEYAQ